MSKNQWDQRNLKKGDYCVKGGSVFIFVKYNDDNTYQAKGVSHMGCFHPTACNWGCLEDENPILPATSLDIQCLHKRAFEEGYYICNGEILKCEQPINKMYISTPDVKTELVFDKNSSIIIEDGKYYLIKN